MKRGSEERQTHLGGNVGCDRHPDARVHDEHLPEHLPPNPRAAGLVLREAAEKVHVRRACKRLRRAHERDVQVPRDDLDVRVLWIHERDERGGEHGEREEVECERGLGRAAHGDGRARARVRGEEADEGVVHDDDEPDLDEVVEEEGHRGLARIRAVRADLEAVPEQAADRGDEADEREEALPVVVSR